MSHDIGKRVAARWRVGMLVLALAYIAAPAFAGDATERIDTIRKIIGERGEYDTAEPLLKSFIEENRGRPAAAEALVLLGYCQDKLKKNTDAASSYSRVLAEYPGAPDALKADASLGAADASFRLGRYADAVKFYTQTLDLTEKAEQSEAALLWRGEAAYRLGIASLDAGDNGAERLAAAANDFMTFIERHPRSKNLASALSGAAFACFDGGDYDRAHGYFQRFVKEFPDDRRYDECAYYMGESLYRLKRYDEARTVFGDLLRKSPSGQYAADARGGVAWADYGLRRIREAAEGFEEAAKLAEGDRDRALSFLYDAGCAWREAGDITRAAAPFQEVAKAKDHELNSLAWFRLGTLWQEQAKTARERADAAVNAAERDKLRKDQEKIGGEAAQYFRRAIAAGGLGAEEIEARSLLGEVLLDAGRFDEAADVFKEIPVKWPDSERAPWALYHEALAEREGTTASRDDASRRDGLRRAAAALRKSLEYPAAKTRLQAAWALADYQAALGETEAAREQYRWLATEGQNWAAAWRGADGRGDPALENRAREYAADSLFRLGESHYFANDYPRAAGFYQEITGKYAEAPQSAMAKLRLGEIAEAGKDAGTALARYEEALNLGLRFGKNRVGPTIGYAQLRLGTLLLREGQKDADETARRRRLQEALRNLTAVVNDPPAGLNPGRALYYLAEAKYSLGLKKEAIADYENSIKADPQGDVADAAWFGLAWDKRDLGDAEGAVAACRRVIDGFSASPLRPDAYVLMASVKRGMGDSAGALADFDDFLAEYPAHTLSAKAELERASALDETGQHAEAAAAFQKFLQDHPNHPDTPQALYQRSWALWNQIRPQALAVREAETRLRDLTGGRAVADLPEADQVEARKAEDEVRGLSAQVKTAEDEIMSSLRNLADRYPDYPVVDAAWLRIGEILYDRSDFQNAMAAYQRSLALAEGRSSDIADKAQYRLAWSVQRLAETAERDSVVETDAEKRDAIRKDMWDKRVAAIDAFETIIGRYPKSDLVGDASFRAAELRRRSGQDNSDPAKRSAWLQSAEQRYRQALEKGGADAPYRRAAEYGEGMSFLLDGKNAEAREVFQRLLLRYQDGQYVQESYWGLGQANLNLGAYADASSAFEQALALDKATETAAKARYGLGLTAAMSGDREKARIEFLAVDALYPHYPEWAAAALVRAARTAVEDGQRDKALGDLERVLARYPDTPAAEEARDMQAGLTAG